MKTKILIGECYAKTLWYGGTATVTRSEKIDDFLSDNQEEDIDFTVYEDWSEDAESFIGIDNITFQIDLPADVDEQELKEQILDEFNKSNL